MRSFLITSNDGGQRLDAFLKKLLPHAPLWAIYRLNRVGKVKVNGKKKWDSSLLEEWDEVKIFLLEEGFHAFMKKDPVISLPEWESPSPYSVLYEDEDLLIVNKHAGVNVHPGDHKSIEVSLIDRVHDSLGTSYHSLTFKPSLVHRLDRDTSGALIIAKTKRALLWMLDLLQRGKIEKIYHAIVLWVPSLKRWTIRKKLFRIENAHHEAKVQVNEESGQTAITHYHVLKEFWKYALIECRLETGRTHQIRVHLASLGTPILWDRLYWNKSENAFAKKNYGISRHMLHAYSLSFPHPLTLKVLTLEAPYPEDISYFLHTIQENWRWEYGW